MQIVLEVYCLLINGSGAAQLGAAVCSNSLCELRELCACRSCWRCTACFSVALELHSCVRLRAMTPRVRLRELCACRSCWRCTAYCVMALELHSCVRLCATA